MFKPARLSSVASGIFLLLFGAAFAGIGGWMMWLGASVQPGWQRSTGDVVAAQTHHGDDGNTYTPIVQFTVDGVVYRAQSQISTSTYPTIGSKMDVAYNPSDPAQNKVIQVIHMLWIFVGVGVAVIGFGVWTLVAGVRRRAVIRSVIRDENKVPGVLVDVTASSTSNNRSNSYTISVAAVDHTGASRTFVSDTLTGIGGLAMADYKAKPIPIDVYIDRLDPNKYYVDIADIPNLTPERIQELITQANRSTGLGAASAPSAPTSPPVPPIPPKL